MKVQNFDLQSITNYENSKQTEKNKQNIIIKEKSVNKYFS